MITDADCDDVAEVKALLNRMGIYVDRVNELNVTDEDGYLVDVGTIRYEYGSVDNLDVLALEYIMENWRRNK